MGWLWGSANGDVEFEAVVADNVIYDADTDEYGRVFLDECLQ